MSITVFGSTGFIGRHLVEQLRTDHRCEIVAVSQRDVDLTAPNGGEQCAPFVSAGATAIVCSGVKRQFGDTLPLFEQNMQMAAALCEMVMRQRPRRVIYLSSAAVYGEENENLEITEQTSVDPRSLYGLAKFTTERLLERAARDAGTELVNIRPALVYGYGDSSKGYGPAGFCESILRGEPVTLWGDGSELREFLYVKDLARAISALVVRPFTGVLNPASGVSRTYRECATLLLAAAGRMDQVQERARSRPKIDNRYRPQLVSAVLPEFRFTPLESGLAEMYSESRNV